MSGRKAMGDLDWEPGCAAFEDSEDHGSCKAIAACIQVIDLYFGCSGPADLGGVFGSVLVTLDRVFVGRGFSVDSGIGEQSQGVTLCTESISSWVAGQKLLPVAKTIVQA